MKTVSIATKRAGDGAIVLATLNNDGYVTEDEFNELVSHVASELCRKMVCEIEVTERNLKPDYSICPTCGGMADDPIVPPEHRHRQWVEPDEQDLLNVYNQFTDSDGWTYEKAIIKMCKELNT